MPKTLVNIITGDNPIPAYLFIKEKYEAGDRIMYISAKDTEDDLDWLSVIDGVQSDFIEEIVLRNDIDEFRYEKICRAVVAHLSREVHYCVNLAGGTRYMALAIQQVFEAFDSEFYYTNIEDNTIVKSVFDNSIYDNDDMCFPIKYRMNIAEYLQAHELLHDLQKTNHKPILPFAMAEHMFQLFANQLLSFADYRMMEALRERYRNRRRGVALAELEHSSEGANCALAGIRGFLKLIALEPQNDRLTHAQLEWITGGWFEEYLYYKVQRIVKPDDLAMGIHIGRKGIRLNNELDVVFMKDNQLFVIECKTGVQTERMFNEIVYKACALKESLLGVSCHSFIASLKADKHDDLKKVAQNMDITFWDYQIMTNQLNKELVEIAKLFGGNN